MAGSCAALITDASFSSEREINTTKTTAGGSLSDPLDTTDLGAWGAALGCMPMEKGSANADQLFGKIEKLLIRLGITIVRGLTRVIN
jgi:hypothetical protein